MRYYEINEVKLPRETAARMSRAKAMGFDIEHVWYHGTKKAIRKFDMRRFGTASGSYHEIPAIFLSSDPGTASDYANVGKKMGGYPQGTWGDERDNFLNPLKTILAAPGVPKLAQNWAESILHGQIDLDAMERDGFLKPEIVAKIRKILLTWEIQEQEYVTAQGARVMPLLVRGNYMHSSMTDDFDEFMYDLHLRHAIAAKHDGVWFEAVIDTTSGHGEPANVLAVLKRNLIRSKFAQFDPAKIELPDLMA